MSLSIIIFLILLGVFLLLVEFLIVPGVTIAGIAGFILLIAGVVLSYTYLGNKQGNIVLLITLTINIASIFVFLRTKTWRKAGLKTEIKGKVNMPTGYYLTWGGQFENQQRAMNRLIVIVPVTIGFIFILLLSVFNSLSQALIVILNLPFALIGGILALFISGLYLSVPASVGFIALFGVAVLNGVVLISYLNQLKEKGLCMKECIMEGCECRLRPVLMTAMITIFSLIPLLFATGPGSEVQRPLAVVVMGGLITSTLLTLFILPVIYSRYES